MTLTAPPPGLNALDRAREAAFADTGVCHCISMGCPDFERDRDAMLEWNWDAARKIIMEKSTPIPSQSSINWAYRIDGRGRGSATAPAPPTDSESRKAARRANAKKSGRAIDSWRDWSLPPRSERRI